MLRSIVLKDLKETRRRVLIEAHGLGVKENSETASKIFLAVGEVIANCRIHGGCENIDICVARVGEGIDVRIKAPCYSEPDQVRRWFDRDCMDVASNEEGGRGCGITREMTDKIMYHPGAIDLIFALPFAEQVSVRA